MFRLPSVRLRGISVEIGVVEVSKIGCEALWTEQHECVCARQSTRVY